MRDSRIQQAKRHQAMGGMADPEQAGTEAHPRKPPQGEGEGASMRTFLHTLDLMAEMMQDPAEQDREAREAEMHRGVAEHLTGGMRPVTSSPSTAGDTLTTTTDP